jgi:hypothetical protein
VLVLCTLLVPDAFEKRNIFTLLKMRERNRARSRMKYREKTE